MELLTILQCTGQHPQWRVILPKMSTIVSFKNLTIEAEKSYSNSMAFPRSQNDAWNIRQCLPMLASQNPNIFYHYATSGTSIQLMTLPELFFAWPKRICPWTSASEVETITYFWHSSTIWLLPLWYFDLKIPPTNLRSSKFDLFLPPTKNAALFLDSTSLHYSLRRIPSQKFNGNRDLTLLLWCPLS